MLLKLKKAIYRLLNPAPLGRKEIKRTKWYAFKYRYWFPLLVYGKPKIFCIGMNKTGTTSLATAMEDLGFPMGNQYEAEYFLKDWEKRDFRRIISHCRHAQFFQDVPFSMPETYKVLDQHFPGSKFILTVRDSPEQWYNSLVSFHTKFWSPDSLPPRREHLEVVDRRYEGWAWDLVRLSYRTTEADLYNQKQLTEQYTHYIQEVEGYFQDRPNDLLILNVAADDAYEQLCAFLGLPVRQKSFPWKNRT
jgi:hypothetical protein